MSNKTVCRFFSAIGECGLKEFKRCNPVGCNDFETAQDDIIKAQVKEIHELKAKCDGLVGVASEYKCMYDSKERELSCIKTATRFNTEKLIELLKLDPNMGGLDMVFDAIELKTQIIEELEAENKKLIERVLDCQCHNCAHVNIENNKCGLKYKPDGVCEKHISFEANNTIVEME